MRWMARVCLSIVTLVLVASTASAAPMEARVALHDGRLSTADLTRVLLDDFHLSGMSLDVGKIDMNGLAGTALVRSLNAALGDGCNVKVHPDALVLHVDSEKLPHNLSDAKLAVRVFTATAAPVATAAQKRSYGLLMPRQVDPHRPMVVLVHGLDCNRSNWFPMADLLIGDGFQVAYFTYPSDGPLEESAGLLTRDMKALRDDFPQLPLNIVAHSMGGLVARRYVEGDDYAGGVKHLILLGTPNLGSHWAAYRIGLEIQEHYQLWRHEKDWSPTWMITDGLGEAGRDLKPTSYFLKSLNARPRREDVAYTIVAGSQHPIYPMTANALEKCANVVPTRAQHWWGFRQTESALHHASEKIRSKSGTSDGPVSIKNTQLGGVDDFLVLPADHASLYYPVDGKPPAAWAIIRDRLNR
jgi:triacylglycerol esterase/lipase EstA (alpha/beta hydrolase family)